MRIDEQLKTEVESIFKQLGMTTTEAIKVFFSAVRNRRGLPFVLQLENRHKTDILTGVDRLYAVNDIMGRYANVQTSSEEFARRKQIEIDYEERGQLK